MASDLKFEIFAYKWFHRKVLGSEVLSSEYNVMEVYKDEYLANPECVQVSDCDYFYEAIYIRVWLFQKLYLEEIHTQINEFRHSQKDFYYYVLRTCNRVDLFGNLKIFDRVFATCAFVCCLCRYCCKNGYSEIMRYGYLCWAMYFEDHIDEFYKLGGWTRLKMVAVSYKPPIDFLHYEKAEKRADITLIKIRKVINRYNLFKNIGEIDYDKSISVSWVKFYINCMNGSSIKEFNQFTNESHSNDIKHCSEVEDILKKLKYLCDPNGLEIIKILSQQSTIDSLVASMANLNICDKYVNLDSKEETILTAELNQGTAFVNLASKSDQKLNAVEENVLCMNPDEPAPIHSETSSKRESLVKIRGVSEADYTKTEYFSLKSRDQDMKTTKMEHLFENMTLSNLKREKGVKRNASLIGEIPTKRENAYERCSKNTEDDAKKEHNEWKNSKEIVIPIKEKKKISKIKCKDHERKSKKGEKKNTTQMSSTRKTVEEENKKAKNSIRKEQNDSDIKNFLRMLLVLDDKQGISYVRKTLKFDNKEFNA